MQDYLMIGVVLRPQGVHGECRIRPYAADLDRFAEWKTLYLEENGGYTPVGCAVHRIHDGIVYATLGDCATPEDVERLRNRQLFIDRAHAAPPAEGSVYIADLLGCEAVTREGTSLGVLTDVLQHGSVDTWVFRAPDGGTWMAPALLDAFPEVDPEARRITVHESRLREVAVFED